MPSAEITTQGDVPDMLYHIKRTVINLDEDKSGATRTVDILSTYTDLKAAKEAARKALFSEGYVKEDFEIYEEHDHNDSWTHDQGVRVYAKAPAGQEFEVRIDTKSNTLKVEGDATGEVNIPLYYVLQTIVDYNNDRVGGLQTTEVEGTYLTYDAARDAAMVALIDSEVTKDSFAEYDERMDEKESREWPYGDDVLVHAVSETGENFLVSVKAKLPICDDD